jgi:hypothetical protein
MTTPKQQLAFPEVAVLRKGTPKVKGSSGNFIQGSDLGNKFRVSFYPGTTDAKAAFAAAFSGTLVKYDMTYRRPGAYAEADGFEVERIRAMVPFRSVFDAWEWANEAHSAGRMIAKADDTHYLMLRDPINGEYKVKNGEPLVEYAPGQDVVYERNGKQYRLPIRTVGRLRLFIPALERMVFVTLKTTSFYDRLNIDQQLSAIQFLANTLNNGNAAGIPFYVYRREQEVTWNKPDGSAARVKKWLVNIEADPEWVKSATSRMANFALTGDVFNRTPMPQLTGPVSPVEVDEPGDIVDPEFDEEPLTVTAQTVEETPIPAPVPVPAPTPAPAAAQARPYPPEVFKDKFAQAVAVITQNNHLENIGSKQRQIVAAVLDTIFNGEKTMRYETLEWLCGKSSTKDLGAAQVKAILRILDVEDFEDAPRADAMEEFRQAHAAALIAKGQQQLQL